jgi:hypothetical protein
MYVPGEVDKKLEETFFLVPLSIYSFGERNAVRQCGR